jgi:hypothetical protein
LLPGAVLIAIILWIIWTRTATVPYWDEWATVTLVQHANAGTLSFADLWMFHGVHRIVVPRIVDLLLIQLTHWNRQVEMTFDLTLAVASACLLNTLLSRTVGSTRLALVLVAPLSLLYFSLAQFANWFAPFQIAFTATLFGLLLALWAVTSDEQPLSWPRFGLALLGALIAMLSSLQGLMVWLAVLPTLAWHLRRAPRPMGIKLLLWIGIGIEAWLVYLAGVTHYTDRVPLRDQLTYVLVYLGAPIGFPDAARSELFGLMGLALWPATAALYIGLGGRLTRLLPWVDVAVFVALVTAATVDGRSINGTESALSSRYEIFSALWWISLVILGTLVLRQLWRGSQAGETEGTANFANVRAWGLAAWGRGIWHTLNVHGARQYLSRMRPALLGVYSLVLVVMLASLLVANIAGLQDALLWLGVQQRNQYRLLDYQSQPDLCLKLYDPWPSDERSKIAILDQGHYGLFALSAPERQRLLRAAEAAGDTSGCVKPYDFINDAGGLAPAHRPW